MNKQEALERLKHVVLDGDTVVYHQHGVKSFGPNKGWEITYSVFVQDLNISHMLADALDGMTINDEYVLKVSKPSAGVIAVFSDARTLTILLGEALGMPAYEHFNFEVV